MCYFKLVYIFIVGLVLIMAKHSEYPEISYTHVLSELSVNRRDPCEVIRELISNSYDASATKIEIYPLLQDSGFIFFDNGIGLSETVETQGITPYKAFFSIGKSTKTIGNSIGYKCQGSKLCFASRKFTLITRCQDEESWRYISIDNPKTSLNPEYNIKSKSENQPWEVLKQLFLSPDERTNPILKYLSESYFLENFKHGAMIIVQDLDIDHFSYFYNADGDGDGDGDGELSYLKNYIRFNTKHGDIRVLRPKETEFEPTKSESFKKTLGYNENCQLSIWFQGKLSEIPVGYPYLSKPDDTSKSQIKSPAEISRLRDGQFYSRHARSFKFEDKTYCLVLAVDGNRRALNNYSQLDRRGQKKSGIRLTDQRGTFICSQGVKICSYNEIFEHSKLADYALLAKDDGQSNYIFFINGNFELVTNRNLTSESALKILRNESFIDKIKDFLDQARKDKVFNELINRLRRENESYKRDVCIQQFNDLKANIQNRTRFKIENIEQLKDKWIVEPLIGEEHWVGALYVMLSHLVPGDSEYANLWMRPLTFSGIGIDSVAVPINEKSLEDKFCQGVEYKHTFSPSEEFNHPLIITQYIICWDMNIPEIDTQEKVIDTFDYFGSISLIPELDGIGYEIINIESRAGEPHGGNVKVISLKKLICKTFRCIWTTPPSPSNSTPKSGKYRRKLNK